MKFSMWTAICGALALVADAASAQPSPPSTRAIAEDLIHIVYVDHDVNKLAAKYVSPDLIQHNPEIADGPRGDADFLEARRKRDPAHYLPLTRWRDQIDHLLVQGDLFAVHHHVFTSPTDRGRVFFDIWRVKNGKLVEHWDVIQPVAQHPLNSNGMWGDLAPAATAADKGPSPAAVLAAYQHVGLDEHRPAEAARLYVSDAFVQHSPHIPDGKSALIAYFAGRQAGSTSAGATSSTAHMIVDGDLVLLHRHVTYGPGDRGKVYADLFRVRGGKIVEHWDVIEDVPPTSVNGHTMW